MSFNKLYSDYSIESKGHLKVLSASVAADAAEDFATPAFSNEDCEIGNRKVLGYLEVLHSDAGGTSNLTLVIQGSVNGTTWVDLVVSDTNQAAATAGAFLEVLDLTSIYAPYYRFVVRSSGAITTADSDVLVSIAA